ncbi:hypothetical protein [Psychroserpens damuponensis]|uniref:hypothetical protein n=1 Tax=Psychroserpens damuponensis TaxID=943936 RepID=UPI00058E2E8F|nr:hypothetical protein [Psychroserpens damuponensis]
MKKVILLICIITTIYSCKSKKVSTNKNYFIGIENNYQKRYFDKDSLNLIAPIVQLRYVNNGEHYFVSKDVTAFNDMITNILKAELNTSDIITTDLDALNQKKKNKVLEKVIHDKFSHPNWIMKAPEEIIVPNKKYTLLVEINGIYGDRNNGQISFSVINNITEVIEIVDKEKFYFNPKNEELVRELIARGISKLIRK